MRVRATLGVLLASLALAASASAGVLSIDFDLSESSFGITVPPSSSTMIFGVGPPVGSLRLTLTGVDASGALTGSSAGASLSMLRLSIGVTSETRTPQGDLLTRRTNTIALTQMGSASGALAAGGAAFDAGALVGIQSMGNGCEGRDCLVTQIVLAAPQPFANVGTFELMLNALNQPGAALLRGRLMTTDRSVLIQGREIARSFVPEPLPAGLLGLALVALGGATALGRRRAGRA